MSNKSAGFAALTAAAGGNRTTMVATTVMGTPRGRTIGATAIGAVVTGSVQKGGANSPVLFLDS